MVNSDVGWSGMGSSCRVRVRSCSMYRVHRSLLTSSQPSAMMASNSVRIFSACFMRSAFSRSRNSRFTMPRQHPSMTPSAAPSVPTHFVLRKLRCACVIAGASKPHLIAIASTAPPKMTPATSLKSCPNAAATSVKRRKWPKKLSMRSPAWIMMVLSIRPKPTMGTAQAKKCCHFWRAVVEVSSSSSLEEEDDPPEEEPDPPPLPLPLLGSTLAAGALLYLRAVGETVSSRRRGEAVVDAGCRSREDRRDALCVPRARHTRAARRMIIGRRQRRDRLRRREYRRAFSVSLPFFLSPSSRPLRRE
eukprot:Rhum_TRINITY_DN8824_c0_g1::Rhum_TRINITY_DN8824_c0_g1_i1::g.30124::m.30124